MPFPIHDTYWVNALNFLQSHMKEGERLFAPSEFRGKLPSVRGFFPYGTTLPEEDLNFQWAVIHKGLLNKIEHGLLNQVTKFFIPVFANEVFVVFSSNKEMPQIDLSSLHLRSLWEKMGILKPSTKGLKRILKPLLFHEKEETKKKSDISEEKGEECQREGEGGDLTKRASVYLGDYRALTRTIWGHKIYVDTRDIQLTPHILLDGFWEMGITRVFMGIVEEGMNVVEIGANIGYYTLVGASQIGSEGRLYAFEANPQVFRMLCKSIEINGFLDRVTLVNQAVLDRSKNLKFHLLKDHQASGSIQEFSQEYVREYREEMETIEVDAISLDEYFADKAPRIDVVKIDAEGSEPFIFKGMKKILKNPSVKIISEFSPGLVTALGEDPGRFLEEILKDGFKLKFIDGQSQLVDIDIDGLLGVSQCELFLER